MGGLPSHRKPRSNANLAYCRHDNTNATGRTTSPKRGKCRFCRRSLPSIPGPGYDSIKVPPNCHYITQWRMNEDPGNMRTASWLQRIQWHLFFHPGTYTVQVHAHFWSSRPDMEKLCKPMLLRQEHKTDTMQELLEQLSASSTENPEDDANPPSPTN